METTPQIYFLLVVFSFMLTVVMHVLKKNVLFVWAYALQSALLSVILALLAFQLHEMNFLIAAVLTIVVKVAVTLVFLLKRIRDHEVYFTASSYVNTPLALAVVMAIIVFAHSAVFAPVNAAIASEGLAVHIPLIFSSILISLFLMINRKGALSQIIGLLSLENGIILLASFIGLKQSLTVELGIAFDSAVWIIIASIFLSMLYRHFGSLDVARLRQLTED